MTVINGADLAYAVYDSPILRHSDNLEILIDEGDLEIALEVVDSDVGDSGDVDRPLHVLREVLQLIGRQLKHEYIAFREVIEVLEERTADVPSKQAPPR